MFIRRTRGFTIIEVVLVLAIAGLIFMVVFFSIGALQRSQRDSQRKSDLGRMFSLLTTYSSKNLGTYPGNDTAVATFNTQYISNNAQLRDPSTGQSYTVVWGDLQPDTLGEVYYNVRSRCLDGGIDVHPVGGSEDLGLNEVAIAIKLESGTHCLDTTTR